MLWILLSPAQISGLNVPPLGELKLSELIIPSTESTSRPRRRLPADLFTLEKIGISDKQKFHNP